MACYRRGTGETPAFLSSFTHQLGDESSLLFAGHLTNPLGHALFVDRSFLGLCGALLGFGGLLGFDVSNPQSVFVGPCTVEELTQAGDRVDLADFFTFHAGVLGHGDEQGDHVLTVGRYTAGSEEGGVTLQEGDLVDLAFDKSDKAHVGVVGGLLPLGLRVAGRTGSGFLLSVGVGGGHSGPLFLRSLTDADSLFGEKPLRHVKAQALCRGAPSQRREHGGGQKG